MSDNPMMFTYINETITMDEWELKIVFLFFFLGFVYIQNVV